MRYFFETAIGSDISGDRDGVDLSNDDDARELALRTLGEMARDAIRGLEHGAAIAVRVTDDKGDQVCDTKLEFACRHR